jgi:hypothetical protein
MNFLPEATDVNSLYITLTYLVASGKNPVLDFMNYENFMFFMVDIAGVSGAHLEEALAMYTIIYMMYKVSNS